MLAYLRVRNLAVLREVELVLGPGLNVLTGETGAGKSLLVDAVGLLLGERADGGCVREGEARAVVEGQFAAPDAHLAARLAEAGIDTGGEDGLLVRRELRREGPNRIHINGTLAPLSLLRGIMSRQVALHGQNRHMTLASPDSQGVFFDAAVGATDQLAELTDAWDALRHSADERRGHAARRAERERQLDFVRLQLREIDAVRPVPGEDEELRREERLLAGAAERLERSTAITAALLEGEPAASDLVARALNDLVALAEIDTRLADVPARLREAAVLLDDVAATVRDHASAGEMNSGRLDAVQTRLADLQRLTRKYGGDLTHVARLGAELRAEALELEDFDGAGERLCQAESAAATEFDRLARAMTRQRENAAADLSAKMQDALADLGLAGARFEVGLTGKPPARGADADTVYAAGGPSGYERASFLFTAHAGETPGPLARVASGGELSRLMLALQLVLRNADGCAGPSTFIFDEVDAGVGGEQAIVLARRLQSVAEGRQVLCVTHLPQVAAAADRHLHIDKQVQDGRAQTSVRKLDRDERVAELARMLGRDEAEQTARRHARALVDAAARVKKPEGPARPAGRRRRLAGGASM